ncbi:hypothetical protein GW932_00525 [archaeon]|nr:hypothetical protein [archaeon]
MTIKKAIDSLFKQDEIIPFEEGKKIFDSLGIDLDKLKLTNWKDNDYHKSFENLELTPYMDVNEMKIKVTGKYNVIPCDWHLQYQEKGISPQGNEYKHTRKIKINTFGRIKK